MYKYQHIYNDIERKIKDKVFVEGAKIPSIRNLCTTYNCNKATIINALQTLEQDHFIYSVPKSGYYVVNRSVAEPEPSEKLNFSSSIPKWSLFPYFDFQHCINKSIEFYQQDLFTYDSSQGFAPLISSIVTLLESYQVFTKTKNTYITSGAQQALYILSQIPFPNNNTNILVEQPTYHVYNSFLNTRLSTALGIRRSADGIDFDELERIFREEQIKFFYVIPRFHNPLGTSYTKSDKLELLRLAYKYNVYIVEDDYLADFDHNSKVDPIFAYDIHQQVIYLKSFSKVIFPSIRLAAAVIPDALGQSFHDYKRHIDINSSMVSQAALEVYIKNGMFSRNKKIMSQSYYKLAQELQKALTKLQVEDSNLRIYFSAQSPSTKAAILLPPHYHMAQISTALERKNIIVESIAQNYLNHFQRENILKLDVSTIDIHQIGYGIEQITNDIIRSIR